MKDKYFLLNGRSYPDTVNPGPLQTQSTDGVARSSQPLPADHQHSGGRQGAAAHLGPQRHRVPDAGLARHPDDGDRAERQAAARPGRQQPVLQDQLDHARRRRVARRDPRCLRHDHVSARAACSTSTRRNLDHLSNDAENFGGMMTEVHICTRSSRRPSLQLGEQPCATRTRRSAAAPARRCRGARLAARRRRAGRGARHHRARAST